jgi:hypothetical protein
MHIIRLLLTQFCFPFKKSIEGYDTGSLLVKQPAKGRFVPQRIGSSVEHKSLKVFRHARGYGLVGSAISSYQAPGFQRRLDFSFVILPENHGIHARTEIKIIAPPEAMAAGILILCWGGLSCSLAWFWGPQNGCCRTCRMPCLSSAPTHGVASRSNQLVVGL